MSSGIIADGQTPGEIACHAVLFQQHRSGLQSLVSGFYLIGLIGLPGTMLTAGLTNFAWRWSCGWRPGVWKLRG
jgi:hypothetical protein